MASDAIDDKLQAALSDLRSSSWMTRLDAVQALTEILSKTQNSALQRNIVQQLSSLTEEEKWEVKKAVANAFAVPVLPKESMIDLALAKLQKDANRWVRQTAERAISLRKNIDQPTDNWALSIAAKDPHLSFIAEKIQDLGPKGPRALKPKELFELATQVGERLYQQLGADTAHEIRTVLTPLLGFAEELQDYLKKTQREDETTERYMDAIFVRLHFMGRLVDDISDYAHTVKLEKEIVQLQKLILESLELSKEKVTVSGEEISNVTVELKVDSNVMVLVDAFRFTRALINLISNAFQAMPQGGNLTIASDDTWSDSISLFIQDTGVGMSGRDVELAFQRFKTNRRDKGGTGLGIPIAKKIIEDEHGGNLTIESKLGKGTTILVEIPRRQDSNGS